MHQTPQSELEEFFSLNQQKIDNGTVIEFKKNQAEEFKKQLTDGKVKLHLAFNLHAKLYLAYRQEYNTPSKISPRNPPCF